MRSKPHIVLLVILFTTTYGSAAENNNAPLPDHLKFPSLDSMETVYQPYLERLRPHEPTYFLVGADPSNSKFQFSFKYQLLGDPNDSAPEPSWINGFHFGYTQTSYWDLKSDSKPFDDSSYKPEFFYLSPNLDWGLPGVRALFIRTGLQHESNGRGGVSSRSTNFAYVKPMFIFYREDSTLGFAVSPKMWFYFGNDNDTNPDLEDYRGYFDLEVKCGWAQGLICTNHLYWAEQGGSWTVDLTYPLPLLNLYLQVQYADTLAEVLRNYQDRRRVWRIGLAIVR